MVRWEPVVLELEVSAVAWDEAVAEVERWNRQRFKGEPWVTLTADEAVEALAHYGFRPLVRGLLKEGAPALSMAVHLAPRRADGGGISSAVSGVAKVREERVALTISDRGTGSVRFAISGEVPHALERAAREPLSRARAAARSALVAAGVTE